ncbi:MAG: right-handed parallel beta-helix repeat-containing protein, partial [Bacteroidetes bacterium]|nr:right-handed parallel beta-helix repeat-containing protein [Bacteroidota bacterium]
MHRIFCILILPLLFSISAIAATYYVSSLGDNDNTGASEESPFQTVQFAIDQMNTGDILIVLDGFYTGTLKLKPGITVRAKNPRKVIFSGAEPLGPTFEKHDENIYKTRVNQEIKQVFFNDMPMLWAQWPNIHWTENWVTDKKWVKSGNGSDQGVFTCNEFSEISELDLAGGYCFLKYGKGNSCYSRPIEAFDGDRLYWNTERFFSRLYAGEDGYKGTAPNSEFFLAGAFDLIDVPGEWIVMEDTLYLFPPAGTDPNDAVILAKTNDYCIYQEEALSDITIEGIDILASSVKFAAPDNDNISFNDVHFTYIGEELLYINRPEGAEVDKPIYADGTNISFEKCLFAGGKNSALKVSGSGIRIENCVFMENNRHANFESRPLVLNASGTYKIKRNTFFNNCSDAMRITHSADYVVSAPQEVSYNNICNAGKYNTDVSGIYMPNKSQFYANVHHNWIHNVKGNAYRLDRAGIELNLHHNVFWESKRGINVEGFGYFNIYNNTSFHHHSADVIMKNITDQSWYPGASHDSTFAPIEDWMVLNNLVEAFEDAVGPTEKDLLNAQKEKGLLHPERMENFNIPVWNRGTIQGNMIGNNRPLFTNSDLSALNLLPNDNSIVGGVAQSPELEAQGITSLDGFRGAYDVNGEYWYPGSDWMPYGLPVINTMAEAEAFAKAYYAVSIMPEINVQNLPMGYLLYPLAHNTSLASITWPDYGGHEAFAGWKDLRQDTLPEFAPDRYLYTIELPASHKKVPALTASPQVFSAHLAVKRATSLRGTLEERTTTFTISSEFDSTLRSTYKVVFNITGTEQAVNSEPFFSELILGRHNHDDYIEIFNPGTETDSLDLSRYLLLNVPIESNENDIFSGFKDLSANSPDIHYCYVPGYKYDFDASGNWANGIQGRIVPDHNVNARVAAGDVFLMGSYGSSSSGSADLEVVLQGGATDDIVDVNLINNPDFPTAVQGKNVTDYKISRALFLYKIVNDSILNGSKGIWESLEDYELIDHVQWDETSMGNIIAGVIHRNGSALIRKPHVQGGMLLANGGFQADADSSDWIHYSRNNNNTAEEWKKVGTTMGDNLGFHHADDFTAHISTITSAVYQVDPGFEGDLQIIGDLSATTVAGFIAKLIKVNDLQLISIRDIDGEKAGDTLMADGDSVTVVSANGINQTTYTVENRLLSSNTALTALDGSGIIVDHPSLILSGFDDTVTIA